MNQFEIDVMNRTMQKLAYYNQYMEKDAAAAVNGISQGLGGQAFGRALANGMFNRNGLVFKSLGYSMPNGSGVIGGSPFLIKGLNKPFLLDAPITERIKSVNNMFNMDNLNNLNLF